MIYCTTFLSHFTQMEYSLLTICKELKFNKHEYYFDDVKFSKGEYEHSNYNLRVYKASHLNQQSIDWINCNEMCIKILPQ